MSLPTLTVQELTSPQFVENNASLKGDYVIVLSDGTKVTMPVRLALVNAMLWNAYLKFGLPITKDRIFWFENLTDETVNECCTKIYREMVLVFGIDNLYVLAEIWHVTDRIFHFIRTNCREYCVSMDALSLSRMCMQPKMNEVCTREIDENLGTHVAEQQFAKITDDLNKILTDPKALAYNPLAPYIRTKLLKRNQLPQMFCAYGPRSDIDDSMMKHVINANAFSGLVDIRDFATEYLSAKKAQYFNSTVIKRAQYFGRRMRLGASRLHKLYSGWCGSELTLPFVIDPRFKKNFIGKFIKVDKETLEKYDTVGLHLYNDSSLELTKANIDHFVGKEVQMWSPFGCRHTDGVCEHCAGFMSQKATAFVPPGIQIGVFSATKLAAAVTQKILSAKHLIKTNSREFVLSRQALKYVSLNSDALMWQSTVIKMLKNCKLRVSAKTLGPITDLQHDKLPSGAAWSVIDKMEILGVDNNIIDNVLLTDGIIHPFFSGYMMSYLQEHYGDLILDANYLTIPLKHFDFSKAVFKFTAVNDDMIAYVYSVEAFLSSKVCTYRNVSKLLSDFCALVYSKNDVSIFYIEIMLRALLVASGGEDHRIPALEDLSQSVEFDKLSSAISESALSTKLAFEHLEELFERPEPTLEVRGAGYGFNDPLFNMSKLDD